MSGTTAVHVCYNFLYITLPSSAKQQREMTKSALSGERELQRLIFWNSFSNLSLCPRFSFVITLTIINKAKWLRVTRDSLVKYKFIFNRRCLLRRRSSFLNSLLRPWQTRTHCCGHIDAHDVSWAAQTEKHFLRAQNVSEQNQKHFFVSLQQMLRARANWVTFVSATMFPQQCVLVCQGL